MPSGNKTKASLYHPRFVSEFISIHNSTTTEQFQCRSRVKTPLTAAVRGGARVAREARDLWPRFVTNDRHAQDVWCVSGNVVPLSFCVQIPLVNIIWPTKADNNAYLPNRMYVYFIASL